MESYKDLKVWQRAVDLAEFTYRDTMSFPPEERLGLISQARRAAVSIPANIAEGWGRGSTKEYIHFLMIARGSLMELETHLILAYRLKFLPTDTFANLVDEVDQIGKMLNGLVTSLRNK